MLLIPAIDLSDGRCVRLLRGSFSDSTTYSNDPVETARSFEGCGIRWLHVVDLDAAEGKGRDNRAVIGKIRSAVSCRMEVGGGVRSEEQARALLDIGVDRIVLGTVLVRSPDIVAGWIQRLGRSFIGGIDARDGRVKVSGWASDGGAADAEVAAGLAALGICWLIYTNISKDGTLSGPDIERTNAAAWAARLPTILSGGIGSEADVEKVARKRDPLVAGAILGKALYEARVDLAGLVRRFPQDRLTAWESPKAT